MTAAGHDATFSDLAIKIVTSRQFRHRAGDESPAPRATNASSATQQTAGTR
jgi:hypothetical protein